MLESALKEQLKGIFAGLEANFAFDISVSSSHENRAELLELLGDVADCSDHITYSVNEGNGLKFTLLKNGNATGITFRGIPNGHEFTSFIMGLYNVAGPGQALDGETMDRIKALDAPTDMQIFVSLSCTMCPELVIAAQHIAALNPNVRTEAYDLNHFPALKETYNVMSVPCLVLNGEKVLFGKKSISQLLDTLEQQEQKSRYTGSA